MAETLVWLTGDDISDIDARVKKSRVARKHLAEYLNRVNGCEIMEPVMIYPYVHMRAKVGKRTFRARVRIVHPRERADLGMYNLIAAIALDKKRKASTSFGDRAREHRLVLGGYLFTKLGAREQREFEKMADIIYSSYLMSQVNKSKKKEERKRKQRWAESQVDKLLPEAIKKGVTLEYVIAAWTKLEKMHMVKEVMES